MTSARMAFFSSDEWPVSGTPNDTRGGLHDFDDLGMQRRTQAGTRGPPGDQSGNRPRYLSPKCGRDAAHSRVGVPYLEENRQL